MKKLIVVGGIIVAAFVAFFGARYFFDEPDELTGTWALFALEVNGEEKAIDDERPMKLTFDKGRVAWTLGAKQLVEGEYKFDPNKSPKVIDLTTPLNGLPTGRGIYAFKEGVLIICMGATRPPALVSGKGIVVMVFKRR